MHSATLAPSGGLSRFVLLAGGVVLTLGIVVMLGWHTRNLAVIRVLPTAAPMYYNTALCFVLSGIGLLAVASKRDRLARLTGGIGGTLGGLTFSQYLFDVDLGIDQALMTDWVGFGSLPPGRMALATAVGFALSGLGLIDISGSMAHRSARGRVWAGVAGMVSVTLGLVTLGMYMTDLMAAEDWGHIAQPMAVHTAVGLTFVGASLLRWVWQAEKQRQSNLMSGLPTVAGVSIVTATLLLWQALLVQQQGFPVAARTVIPMVLLGGGLLMAMFVMVIVVLAQRAQRQARETTVANYVLQQEIAARKQIAAALRESEERFRLFMDHSPAVAWIRDTGGRYVYFNQTYERRFGVRLAEWHGKTDGELQTTEETDVFGKNDQAVLAASSPIEVIEDTLNPDGTRGTWWSFKFPLQDAAKKQYVAGIGVDITARKQAEEALRTLNAELDQRVQERTSDLERTNAALQTEIAERTRTEEVLQESEKRLRAALAAGNLGTWRLDLTTGVLDSSPICKTNFGLSPEAELSYQDLIAAIHPEDRARIQAAVDQAMADRTDYATEYRIFWPDGSIHWILVREWGLYDRGGAPLFMVGVTADITARKQAEEESLRLAAIVASSEDAIVSKSLDGVVTSWNAAAERMFGYRAEEMIGQPILRLLPDDRHDEEQKILERLRRGESVDHIETVRRAKDGRLVDVSVTISPLWDARGTVIGASKIARDITTRKQAEEALAQHARDLARAHADLRQVAYVSAHDLQEPVRQVGVYTQKLAKRYRNSLDTEIQEAIDFIVEGTKRMQAQFTDLLHYLEMEEPSDGIIMTDCELLLQYAFDALQEPIATSGAIITHDPLPTIKAHAKHLQLVFQELLDNTVKFRNSAPPRIHIWAEREKQAWRFAVRDNGIGIDPQWTGRLFGLFRRLHPRQQYPGTGMGLAICRKIVERHGGRIWVESQLGAGTTVFFTINEMKENKE